MSKKNLYLGGVLLLLIVVAFVYNGPFKEWREDFGKPKNFFSELKVSDIEQIEIDSSEKVIVITEEDNNRWKIEDTKDFYVTNSVMNKVFDSLGDAIESEIILVSENPEKQGEFMIDENNRYIIKLKIGEDEYFEFALGKASSDMQDTYVAKIDDDAIYSVKASLRTAFDHDDWYNKEIFALEKDNIKKVRFQYPSREFTIEKDEIEEVAEGEEVPEANWNGTLPYRFSVDNEKVAEVLDLVSSLEAAEIPAQTFEGTGLEKNLQILQFSGDGVDVVLMIG
ncbi:hypothetical protein C0583_04065 [Candidatus Parcubacteria bacterium]|nr:MAG: hypothetical protein C0583_04065 [Candidatus Parcubacteria bacterium]